MSDEQKNLPQDTPLASEPPLGFKALKTLIWEETGVTVDGNDPIMIMRVIQQVSLDEYDRLLARHHQAITNVISDSVDNFANEISSSITNFKEEVLSEALKSMLNEVRQQVDLYQKAQNAFRRQLRIMAGFTLINLITASIAVTILLIFFK